VERLSSNFEQLLHAIVRNPQQKDIGNSDFWAARERNQILNEWNDTEAEFPVDLLLHELFEAQVERAPERTALTAGATALSYAELDARAPTALAQALRSTRRRPRPKGSAYASNGGTDMLAAIARHSQGRRAPTCRSILRFPEERLRFMADDAQLALLVATTGLASSFGLPRERQLLLDADANSIASAAGHPHAGPMPVPRSRRTRPMSSTPPVPPASPRASSSHTARSSNFLTSMAREPGLTADDVLVAVTTLSFDIAVLELQLPLTLGAMVVYRDP